MSGRVRTGRAAFRATAGVGAAPFAGTEHQHQAAVVQWARLSAACGEHPELRWLFAVPNGGLRTAATAGKLRAEGVQPGVPDLLLPVRRGPHGRVPFVGLAIEMKRPGEVKRGGDAATPEQRQWLWGLRDNGWLPLLAFGCDAARAALRWYLAGADANRLVDMRQFATEGVAVAVGLVPYTEAPKHADLDPLLMLWMPRREWESAA